MLTPSRSEGCYGPTVRRKYLALAPLTRLVTQRDDSCTLDRSRSSPILHRGRRRTERDSQVGLRIEVKAGAAVRKEMP